MNIQPGSKLQRTTPNGEILHYKVLSITGLENDSVKNNPLAKLVEVQVKYHFEKSWDNSPIRTLPLAYLMSNCTPMSSSQR